MTSRCVSSNQLCSERSACRAALSAGPVPVMHAAVCVAKLAQIQQAHSSRCLRIAAAGAFGITRPWPVLGCLYGPGLMKKGMAVDPRGEILCVCCAAASQLRVILASDNNLTGPFPTSLGQLQNLRELHLDNNALTGTMPPASPGIL